MSSDLTYNDAVASAKQHLTKGKFAKADVFIINHRGRRFIVKDFGAKRFWERNLIGRLVIGRESRAYRTLAGVKCLPPEFKRLSPFSLAVEYLEGRDLGSLGRGEIGPEIILQFERIVDDLHARGWVHLDLQRRSNILLVNGRVYVVDLASAFHPGGVPLMGRCLTRVMGFFDRLSLIKIKKLFAPDMITEKEHKWIRLRNLVMRTKW